MVVAFAVNASGALGFPDVTPVKFPEPNRTATLEFLSSTLGVTVIKDTEFATVALYEVVLEEKAGVSVRLEPFQRAKRFESEGIEAARFRLKK